MDTHLKMMRRAWDVSKNASCARLHVGCVIASDGNFVSDGWNTSLPGLPTCDEVGHDLVNDSCVRVQHAECMAICKASREGRPLLGADLYVTASCCWPCFRMAASVGIQRIFYAAPFYRDVERIDAAAKALGIELVHLEVPNEP